VADFGNTAAKSSMEILTAVVVSIRLEGPPLYLRPICGELAFYYRDNVARIKIHDSICQLFYSIGSHVLCVRLNLSSIGGKGGTENE